MICPHCGIGTSPYFAMHPAGRRGEYTLATATGNCTECKELILMGRWILNAGTSYEVADPDFLLYPRGPLPRTLSGEVTGEYAQDFREASMVLDISPKASAAISGRLLQHIIHEKAGITKRNLDQEIDAVIAEGDLPSGLADELHMIRIVGNFAAHPTKSTNTGEIVDVEPGEAEYLLNLLEELLDHYIVKPARRETHRAALNEKLADAGRPPLKRSQKNPSAPPVID